MPPMMKSFTRDNWYPCSKEELDFAAHVQELREEAGWGIGLPCYSVLVVGQGSLTALISFVEALLFDVLQFHLQLKGHQQQNKMDKLGPTGWKFADESAARGWAVVQKQPEWALRAFIGLARYRRERLKISQLCSWKSRVGRSD